jgi:hypothetical protein
MTKQVKKSLPSDFALSIFKYNNIIPRPSDLQSKDRDNYNRFKKLFTKQLAELHSGNPKYQHKEKSNAWYFGKATELNKKTKYGARQYQGKRINNLEYWAVHRLGLLDISIKGAQGNKHATGYEPTQKLLKLLAKLFSVDLEHYTAMTGITRSNSTISSDYQSYIEIDIDQLLEAAQDPTIKTKTQRRAYLLALHLNKYGNVLLQQYQHTTFGKRLFAKTELGIQNLSKEVRSNILASYREVDIKASAQSILIQLSNNPENYPALQALVENVDGFRALLEAETNTSIKAVKEALLMVSFGSKLGYTAKTKDIKPSEKVRFNENEIFVQYKEEFSALSVELWELYSRVPEHKAYADKLYEDSLINEDQSKIKGKTVKRSKEKQQQKTQERFLAYLFQRYETEAMRIIADTLPRLNDIPDCLLVHDGIYVRDEGHLDLICYQNLIKVQLNLDLNLGVK